MTRQAISTSGAPSAIGPYSQAIAVDGFVFCSGQLGLDPASGELAEGVEAQAERALRNLAAVLDAAGLGLADVVRTTVFLADIDDFAAVNAVYARYIADPPPARSTFAVGALPKGARVEIDAIARRATSPTCRGNRREGVRRSGRSSSIATARVTRRFSGRSWRLAKVLSMSGRPMAAGRRARSSTTPPTAR